MDLDLTGKRAVVTGASKGIGLATTRALLDEGVQVTATARRSSEELEALETSGAPLTLVSTDLETAEGVDALVEAGTGDGPIDILVNNVGGLWPRFDGFTSIPDEAWSRTLNLNLLSMIRVTRGFLPGLLAKGRGNVITISSINSFYPDPFVIDYAVAKAGVTNLSKSLATEYGPTGLRFNTISPGPVETPMWLGEDGIAAALAQSGNVDRDTAMSQAVESMGGFTTGRFSRPEEVADLVLVLASRRVSNINGSDFVIDGGLIKTL